jgi:large subunit ribosomal protein L5
LIADDEQEQNAPEVAEEAAAETPAPKPRAARAPRKAASGTAAPRAARPARATTGRTRTRTAAAKAEAEPEAEVSAPADAGADDGAAAPARTRTRKAAPPKREKHVIEVRPLPRLMARYRDEIRGQLMRDFGYASSMEAPKLQKIVLNVGLGEALTNNRAMETTPGHIAVISGQRPVITKARRSVAGFKVREGQSIGVMVTLRGRRMYEFLDRMISMALPRIRDFRGISRTSFDGKGNYSLGLREQIMFPEIDYASVDRVRGLQCVIATTAKTDPEGFRLLELLGMPFAREEQTK